MASYHGHITFTAIVALIATAMFTLTIICIAALAYIRSQKPLVQFATPRDPAKLLDTFTLYQYDPKREHPAMLLTVSPSRPVIVPLDSEMGVQMMQVMITPPTPVKRVTMTRDL